MAIAWILFHHHRILFQHYVSRWREKLAITWKPLNSTLSASFERNEKCSLVVDRRLFGITGSDAMTVELTLIPNMTHES